MTDKPDDPQKQDKLVKWVWKMNYCKLHQLPPAQSWAWDRAGRAYTLAHGNYDN